MCIIGKRGYAVSQVQMAQTILSPTLMAQDYTERNLLLFYHSVFISPLRRIHGVLRPRTGSNK